MFNRLVLFGDTTGIPQLMGAIPKDVIKGIVISSIRPQYFDELQKLAADNNLPLLVQPKFGSLAYTSFLEAFQQLNFDMLVCNCYSMIIRKDILESVKYNSINIHWALLPLNRGPNPTQWAIIKDEKKTGISIHYMEEGLDSGDIICQVEEEIKDTDTWVTVNERLHQRSFGFIQENMPRILSGEHTRIKQDETIATKNERLNADSPKIDFASMSVRQIFNLVRAQVAPLKGAYIAKNGERIHFPNYMSMEEVKELRKKHV
jgi:methionyl-tRNA formyltransferase